MAPLICDILCAELPAWLAIICKPGSAHLNQCHTGYKPEDILEAIELTEKWYRPHVLVTQLLIICLQVNVILNTFHEIRMLSKNAAYLVIITPGLIGNSDG